MKEEIKSEIIQQTLTEIVFTLEKALETDSSSKITETIEHEGKEYFRNMSREEFLEETITRTIEKIEGEINTGYL